MPHSEPIEDIFPDCSTDILTYAFESPCQYDRENKPLYIDAEDPSRYLAGAQTLTLTKKLIAGFKHIGLQHGDRVLVHIPGTFIYSVIVFGIIGARGVYTASNPAYRIFEFNHLLNHARPKFIITTKELLPVVEQGVIEQGISLDSILVLDLEVVDVEKYMNSNPPRKASCESGNTGEPIDLKDNDTISSQHFQDFEDLFHHGECDWHRIEDEQTARNTHAAMFATSGTTGLPKLAIFTHFGLVAEMSMIFAVRPLHVVRLMSLPLFLLYGFLFGHVPTIRWGSPLYIMPRFRMDLFLHTIKKFNVTEITLVPVMVSGMVRSPDSISPLLDSVRHVAIGGGQLDEKAFMDFQKMLHLDASIMHGWGMTETGPLTMTRSSDRKAVGTIGSVFPGQEIKILGEDKQIIDGDGEPGVAWIRSRCSFVGYRNPDGTILNPFDKLGWLETGDILSRKGQNYCFVGRSKELIKVKSWQVAPMELESLLSTHPQIADCAVKGVLLSDGISERPRAYIVLKPTPISPTASETATLPPTTQDIYDFAKERLATYKALDGGVCFVDSIPRNAMGKVQKFLL